MAHTCFISHPPCCKQNVLLSLNPLFRSGGSQSERNSKRVFLCSAVEGVDESVTGVSSSKSRLPSLITKGCKLIGCGSAVPKLQISNDDLSKLVDTSDEWISVRTGIRSRRIVSGNEKLTDLATEASKKALHMAQVEPDEVDLILMCTSTPDDLFGSGPMGWTKNVLVIGADALSRYVDWTDRGTCILFGDAAGAVLVQACDAEEDGLLGFDLHSDGEGQKHLNATVKDNHDIGSNGSALFPPRPTSYSCIQMNGKEVFRFAVRCVPQSIEAALEKAGLKSSDIDRLLLHQANQRIIDAVAEKLHIPSENVLSNLANYGNTSAASIPLALDEAVRTGKVCPGHTIATAGFGAGLTWGSAIVRWGLKS